jgi:hypothetical protein
MIPAALTTSSLEQVGDMHLLGQLVRWEVWVFLCCLAAVVGLRLLDGSINTRGMLCDRPNVPKAKISRARAQMLVVTLLVACTALLNLGPMRASRRLDLGSNVSVLLLGGSGALLLARQYLAQRKMT